MKSWTFFVMVVAGLAGAASGFCQEKSVPSSREGFGTEEAAYFEAGLHAAYPGSSVRWGEQDPVLVVGDSRRTLHIGDYAQRESGNALLGIAIFDFKEEQSATADALAKESKSVTPSRTQVLAFKSDLDHKVTSYKLGILDDSCVLSEAKSLDTTVARSNATWPVVGVLYHGFYRVGGNIAAVFWKVEFDINNMQMVRRYPQTITKANSVSGTASELVTIKPAVSGNIVIEGVESGRSLEYPCSDPCVMDPVALITRW